MTLTWCHDNDTDILKPNRNVRKLGPRRFSLLLGGHKDKDTVYYWGVSVICILHESGLVGVFYVVCVADRVCPYIVAWPKVKVTQSDIPFCLYSWANFGLVYLQLLSRGFAF